jgi:uncharacterized membrane protein
MLVMSPAGDRAARVEPRIASMEPVGWIWMIVWMLTLLFAVWLLVRTPGQRSSAEDAMSILRARFARGDISQEEYERARDALLADRGGYTR